MQDYFFSFTWTQQTGKKLKAGGGLYRSADRTPANEELIEFVKAVILEDPQADVSVHEVRPINRQAYELLVGGELKRK